MAGLLTDAEELKFHLLAEGIRISERAQTFLNEANGSRPLTPADYASTSGLLLALDDDVWVNAPYVAHNANFVGNTPFVLDLDRSGLFVSGKGLNSRARFWLPPTYHGTTNAEGEPYNTYCFTHADRVRISPIAGCAMRCKFCDLPYEHRYTTKRVAGLMDALRRARTDEIQPAHHVLISGGTPRPRDVGYVRDVYEATLREFPDMAVDIMMVPAEGLLDVPWLEELGVNELSVNIEIYNRDIAKKVMRAKYEQGLTLYLDFIERAATTLGPGRVRSMLMVGCEPLDDTIKGVRAIAQRGGVPVLSPFRPDPSTPMADIPPPSAELMRSAYLRSREVCAEIGVPLGPSCVPCSHNTLTFAREGVGDAHRSHGPVRLV